MEYILKSVFQKNFQWYVRLFVDAINGKQVYNTEEFTNGYVFAWALYYSSCLSSMFAGIALRWDLSLVESYLSYPISLPHENHSTLLVCYPWC